MCGIAWLEEAWPGIEHHPIKPWLIRTKGTKPYRRPSPEEEKEFERMEQELRRYNELRAQRKKAPDPGLTWDLDRFLQFRRWQAWRMAKKLGHTWPGDD